MPLYFAYGLNMHRADMQERCPGAALIGPARFARHRFFIMEPGYASVRRDPQGVVYGLLWEISLAHIRTLDQFEEVGPGLYAKAQQPVIPLESAAKKALVYIGGSTVNGRAKPGYMERVLDAAQEAGFPKPYLRELSRWLPAPSARPASAAPAPVVPGVRPRFASPIDPGRG